MEHTEHIESHDVLIDELSELCGILPEYFDIFGNKQITSIETKKAILKAMNLNIESPAEIQQEINIRKWRTWKGFIEPVYVFSQLEQPITIPVYIAVDEGKEKNLALKWSLQDEKGQRNEFILSGDDVSIADQQWINEKRYIKIHLQDSERRDTGYYLLHVSCTHPEYIFPEEKNTLEKTSRVIIAPDSCYIPPELRSGRAWGLSVSLYAIRSRRNWGVGDFTDLGAIVRWIADLRGSFVGINPLHAITNTKPYGVSPYFPISRLYRNFIYLDLERIPDVKESEEVRNLMETEEFARKLSELREEELIDYEGVSSLKRKALNRAFEYFYEKHFKTSSERGREFKKYLLEEGEPLESFALYMAMSEQIQKPETVYAWQQWPEEYVDRNRRAVQMFIKTHEKEILLHQYLQWLTDNQLREIAEEVRILGMSIGLYHDLAIGSIGGGSDVWSYPYCIAFSANVGAPPDDFSINGQNWGCAPMIPEKLRETGYELFIQAIKKNMKYGGALRIDHALGLFRLFWIPKGMLPKEGAYVAYPSQDLLRIIALESIRNRTLVIAEDLGTVGENVRETLQRFHMLSYRLLYFERNYPDPYFLSPDKYPGMALCAVTTHDLPTLYGYWVGQDIKIRKNLGIYTDDIVWQKQVEERERDKALMLSALKSLGILPDEFPPEPSMIPQMIPELCSALYEYLARTPCKLVLVSLDDIIGTVHQQNMPGTVDSHPNWIQKTLITLEEILTDKRFIHLAEKFRNYIG